MSARFWSKIDETPGQGPQGECWEWKASLQNEGYGQFQTGITVVLAHRRAYELTHGPIPDDLWVLHHCDNRPCCRPSHLFLGTATDNNADMIAKGRHRAGHNVSRLPGETVRMVRARRLLGQTYLVIASALGLSKSHVGRILRGEIKHFAISVETIAPEVVVRIQAASRNTSKANIAAASEVRRDPITGQYRRVSL